MKKTSSTFIILFGNAVVNLPTSIVIIIVFFVFYKLNAGWFLCIILSSLAGWYTWAYFLSKWIIWAKNLGVGKERLYKLGKIGFINFTYARIAMHFQ